jgi:gliding motility-associated-like protein
VKDKQHIEELFQQTFEGFEAEVRPQVWKAIQQHIPSGPAPSGAESGASSVSSITTAAIVKVAAVVGVSALLVAGGYWLTESKTNDTATVDVPAKEISIPTEQVYEAAEEKQQTPASKVEVVVVEDAKAERQTETTKGKVDHKEVKVETVSSTTNTVSKGTTRPAAKEPENRKVKSVAAQPAGILPSTPTSNKNNEEPSKLAIASIHASVKRGALPLVVTFSNDDPLAENVRWDFGDQSNGSSDLSVKHTYHTPGTYTVVLSVLDELSNAVSKDTISIVVHQKLTLVIPNLITPNGDGINDAFRVEMENVATFNCKIMDRSGNTIYEMNNIYSHWDGRDKFGAVVSPGAYLYVIQAATEDGYSEVHKGILMVKR